MEFNKCDRLTRRTWDFLLWFMGLIIHDTLDDLKLASSNTKCLREVLSMLWFLYGSVHTFMCLLLTKLGALYDKHFGVLFFERKFVIDICISRINDRQYFKGIDLLYIVYMLHAFICKYKTDFILPNDSLVLEQLFPGTYEITNVGLCHSFS